MLIQPIIVYTNQRGDSMDIFDEKGIKTMLIAEMQKDLIDL